MWRSHFSVLSRRMSPLLWTPILCLYECAQHCCDSELSAATTSQPGQVVVVLFCKPSPSSVRMWNYTWMEWACDCLPVVWWLWTRGCGVEIEIRERIEDYIFYVTYFSSSSEPTTTMRDRNRAETGPNESKTSSSSCHTRSMERCECFTQVLNGASKVQYLTLFSISLCVYSAVKQWPPFCMYCTSPKW